MNKTAIKNFAIWARNKLIADINYRAGLLGITKDGIHSALPQSTGQTQFFDIGTAEPYAITGEQIYQRQHLVDLLRQKEKESDYQTAYKYVLEEVAYTWFNRLIAVRFMEVNDYLPSHIRVLSSESGKMEPELVTTPFDADLEFSRDEQQTILDLKNANKLDEVFRLLFIKQCNALNEILPALFEKTSDYTELLLNLSVIDQDGVVWHLVHDIPEADFNVEEGGQVEIIGWLYQYYNTETKNEAFAKKGKITKDEIPAVTQLFTPDWIVRYMVENSVGRLWIEHLRALDESADEATLAASFGWKYYLPEAKQELEVEEKLRELWKERASLAPEQITMIDPCMGSGHILVYGFSVLMQIYENAGYGQRDAAKSILEHNLFGLDIDDRAYQMSYFAVMMKAREYNRRILKGENRCKVYAIQESNGISDTALDDMGANLSDEDRQKALKEIKALISEFKNAKEYGSVLSIEKRDWDLLRRFAVANVECGQLSLDTNGVELAAERLQEIINIAEVMCGKFYATVTNPPYLSEMDSTLGNFVKKFYPKSKHDLCAVFIERCICYSKLNAYVSMITQQGFMFLSRYEKLRKKLLEYNFINMAHLGARAFDAIGGEVVQTTAFTLRNSHELDYFAFYKKLTSYASEDEKRRAFLSSEEEYSCKNEDFDRIPRSPMTYWVSAQALKIFEKPRLDSFADPRVGMFTTDNDRFLREWWEPRFDQIGFGFSDKETAYASDYKWFPYNKGGGFRRWYGMVDLVLYWFHGGEEIRQLVLEKYPYLNGNYDFVLKTSNPYCKPGITWSGLTSGSNSFRLCGEGFFFDTNKGPMLFQSSSEVNLYYLLALLNSKVAQLAINFLNSTISLQISDVAAIPVIYKTEYAEDIENKAKECINICKTDWDSYETSWDFKEHPLIKIMKSSKQTEMLLEDLVAKRIALARDSLEKLSSLETDLNETFIRIYGLDDELVAKVNEKEKSLNQVDAKSEILGLLSYAVGCMFGRYSLDFEGLVYGGGNWKNDIYSSFSPDTDNIIPITDEEYLEDDIVSRLCNWINVVFSENTLEANLDYIAMTIGKKGNSSREIIRNYFLTNFFKDHCQTYSATASGKRPIYWLFDSGKQSGFKALIYLHRYNADTIGNLRIDYLHRMQRIYESEINRMQDMIDHSASAREAGQATKRREKLTKQLKECREYDEKLAHLALSRIELDLDDGVRANYRKLQTANDGKFYEVLADSKNIMSKK